MKTFSDLSDQQGVELMEALQVDNRTWNLAQFSTSQEALDILGIKDAMLSSFLSEKIDARLDSAQGAVPIRELIESIENTVPKSLKFRWQGATRLTWYNGRY